MAFKKENKYRYEQSDLPKDKAPLTIRLYQGDLDKLKNIDDWQDKIRDLIRAFLRSV